MGALHISICHTHIPYPPHRQNIYHTDILHIYASQTYTLYPHICTHIINLSLHCPIINRHISHIHYAFLYITYIFHIFIHTCHILFIITHTLPAPGYFGRLILRSIKGDLLGENHLGKHIWVNYKWLLDDQLFFSGRGPLRRSWRVSMDYSRALEVWVEKTFD